MHQKLVSDPFLTLVNNLKEPMYARNSWKWDILKECYQKSFKKLTLIFPFHPVPFYGQDYEKQKVPETSCLALGCKTCLEKLLF